MSSTRGIRLCCEGTFFKLVNFKAEDKLIFKQFKKKYLLQQFKQVQTQIRKNML